MPLADTIRKLSPSLYRLRLFVFISAGIVVAISTYYLLYVRSQTGYFNNRNFRKLSLISSQIGTKLTNTGSVMEKTCERFIHPLEEDSYKFSTDPALKQQNTTALQEVFKRLKGDSPQIIPFNVDTEKWTPNAAPGSVTLTAVRYEGDSSWLYLDYVSNGWEAGTVIRVQAKTELNGLIQPFLMARIGSHPDQFQNILIAEAETARVILQYDTTQVRLASLDKLTAGNEVKKIDLKEIAQTSNAVDISLAGANYRLFSHPLKLSLPATSANAPSVSWIVTGLIKSDYFQSEAWSISIPYTMLIVFGFVIAVFVFSWPFLKLVLTGPKDRFRTHDVYLLVFATMIVLGVVTAFGLYGFVYLSVEAEMDGQVKTLAAQLKSNFNEELNDALQQLNTLSQNKQLLAALNNEQAPEGDAAAKVGGLGRGFSLSQRIHASKRPSELECPAAEKDIYNLEDTNKVGILPCILSSCQTTYPYFDMVAWIDKNGMQKAKWTVKDYTTQYVSVSDRAYFVNIQKKHFYELGEHKFWLEPIVSRTTGRNQVEISQPIKDSDLSIAFDTRLLSLMDPVLPDAFGFVIINNEGKVLFHSDEVHHLGENLLQESDDDSNLRAAIIGRTDRALNVRYSGEDHRFFVTTLEGFPEWSLVVFRNKQPLRSSFLELLTSTTALFMIHMLILMGAFTVFFIIYSRNKRKAWLWPEKKKLDRYVQVSYVMLFLSFVSLLLTIFLHGQSLVWVSVTLAWFGALVLFLSLRYGPWSRAKIAELGSSIREWAASVFLNGKPQSTTPVPATVSEPATASETATQTPEPPVVPQAVTPELEPSGLKRYDRIYALNMMLLVLLIAIVPMGAFFKYEYEEQIKLFIKHAQFSMATALERRDERIRSQYANVAQLPPSSCEDTSHNHETNILARRMNESWDVYDKFFYRTVRDTQPGTHTTNQPPTSDADFLSKLSALLPASSQATIERRGLMGNSAVTGVCNWDSFTTDRLVLNLNGTNGRPAWPWRRLQTAVPLLGISVLPAIALLLLFIPLFLLIHFMVRKVFLLDVHKPTSHSLKKFLCDKIERNVFVVVNAPFFKKMRFKASTLYLQRFSDLAGAQEWNGTFDESKCGELDVIAFDQFEYQMDDAQMNKRRLALLDELLKKKKTLLLFSTVAPSEYSFENGNTNGDEDGAGAWAEVLISNFFTEYAEDTDDRYEIDDKSSFRQLVEIQRARIMSESLQGRKAKDVKELIDTLYTECARRVPLQDVGLHILKTKDFVTLTKDHLLGRIISQARPYYNYLWRSCSTGEKQTLCHLAQDRRLSHRDPDIQSLLKRELIVRDEGINVFNESFRKFVLASDQRADIAEQDQKAREDSLWQTLKVPIMATMIFVAGFLFWTQQDFFSSSLAVVTGITGLISAVFKLMSVFHVEDGARAAK
jgi:hypothetical protein